MDKRDRDRELFQEQCLARAEESDMQGVRRALQEEAELIGHIRACQAMLGLSHTPVKELLELFGEKLAGLAADLMARVRFDRGIATE